VCFLIELWALSFSKVYFQGISKNEPVLSVPTSHKYYSHCALAPFAAFHIENASRAVLIFLLLPILYHYSEVNFGRSFL